MWKHFITKALKIHLQIQDLMVDNHLMPYPQFQQCHDSLNFLKYCQIIACIPKEWRILLQSDGTGTCHENKFQHLGHFEKVTNMVYSELLLKNANSELLVSRLKSFNSMSDIGLSLEEYLTAFKNVYRIIDIQNIKVSNLNVCIILSFL